MSLFAPFGTLLCPSRLSHNLDEADSKWMRNTLKARRKKYRKARKGR